MTVASNTISSCCHSGSWWSRASSSPQREGFYAVLERDEKDFSVRLIHAIAASVIFDCLYLIVAGPWLVSLIAGVGRPLQSAVLARPRISGLTVLILAVVIPALAAVLAHVRFRKRSWSHQVNSSLLVR